MEILVALDFEKTSQYLNVDLRGKWSSLMSIICITECFVVAKYILEG